MKHIKLLEIIQKRQQYDAVRKWWYGGGFDDFEIDSRTVMIWVTRRIRMILVIWWWCNIPIWRWCKWYFWWSHWRYFDDDDFQIDQERETMQSYSSIFLLNKHIQDLQKILHITKLCVNWSEDKRDVQNQIQ